MDTKLCIKKHLLYEILEHTKDCDYNRSQHFYEYNKYKKCDSYISLLQVISLLLLVFYSMISDNNLLYSTYFIIVIVTAIAAIILVGLIIVSLTYINFTPNPHCTIVFSIITIIIIIICIHKVISMPPISDEMMRSIGLIISIIGTILQMIGYYYQFGEKAQQHWQSAQAYTRLYRKLQFFFTRYPKAEISEFQLAANLLREELSDLNMISPDLNSKTYRMIENNLKDKTYPIQNIISNIENSISEKD